ncbi:peroxiredoxin family protein [Deinococcus oregonensis]|uniref:Peroxiredoxin family protein n=1 Tax=Deinococcus oregonensis TaxID=1805970 RepID=A0ABV6AVW0_9DEIO
MTQTLTVHAVRLAEGDPFPRLSAPLVGGGVLELPVAPQGYWSVVLLYRGDWCPFCRSQLTEFQKLAEQFAAQDIQLFALSADAVEAAAQTVTRHGLTFPVAYGLAPREIAQTHGAYLSADAAYLQATGFVLRPDGTVALALYSSGAVGRLNAADTLGFVQYLRR